MSASANGHIAMRRAAVVLALLAVIVGAGIGIRILVPISPGEPIGRCVAGAIDLDRPVPFSKLTLGPTTVAIAVSGGGSRAAYLAAAVLREIRRGRVRLNLQDKGNPDQSLLDQIDLISGVSGGSLAASYFVARSDELRKADADAPVWAEFLDKMAINYRERQWFAQALARPSSWPKLLFTDYTRGNLASDDYNETLFQGATLGSLPDRPALFINAFDVANHVRFIFSKHYVDTTFFQPRGALNKLSEPQELTSANDLTFAGVDPNSVRISDAVYASSAFPIAYPNMSLRHCGQKILYQGQQIFLSDGALADNSGLITLFTQLRAALAREARQVAVVAIYIDASLDRVDTGGSSFQRRGIEKRYAWQNTVFGHANESINSAIALLQDVGWKAIESSGVVTDQLSLNWETALTTRTGRCGGEPRASWNAPFESGQLAARPLVIRLGLRDIVNPDFLNVYGSGLQTDIARLQSLLEQSGVQNSLREKLLGIQTDFVLSDVGRKTLDLAAHMLVHGKLAGDLGQWEQIVTSAARSALLSTVCGR
jgi:hypothetical protein